MCDDPFEGVTKNCHEPFVPAGEAVIAGVDGVEPCRDRRGLRIDEADTAVDDDGFFEPTDFENRPHRGRDRKSVV